MGMGMNRKERRAAAKQERLGHGRSLSPGQAAKIEKAIGLAVSGNLAEAEELLDAVRRGDPANPEMKHQLGMIYVRTGRAEAGLELLRQAVEASPEESLYWNNLGAACLAIERSQEAVDAARKALSLDPRNFMAWQNLALGLRDLGDHDESVKAFDEAAKLGTIQPTCLATWAECLGSLRRFAEAEAILRTALAVVPEDPPIATLLGWVLSEQKKKSEAREVFRNSLDRKPDQFLAAFNYGILALEDGEVDLGLRWLRRATSIEPKSVAAWVVLAFELAKQGLTAEALPAAERAARLAPNRPDIADLLRGLKDGPSEGFAAISIDFDMPAPMGPRTEPRAEPEPRPAETTDAPTFDLQILKIDD
jgi:predicted Zn-dependent protease